MARTTAPKSHNWWCRGGPHTAREDPRVGSIEGSRCRDGSIEREEVRKKRSRSLSVPSPELVGGNVSLQERGVLQDQRVGQTLINHGSTLAQSNRFPLA